MRTRVVGTKKAIVCAQCNELKRRTEELLVGMAKHLHKQTGLRRLCMAGGVGLNSVGNSRILRESGFEELHIQPAAGDGGGALGAALWAYNALLGKPRAFRREHAYWGRAYSPSEVSAFLTNNNISHCLIEDDEKLLDRVVERLTQGKLVGWFQGRFEWGPRPLGNRSILADARNPEMKDIVTAKIKFREPYRLAICFMWSPSSRTIMPRCLPSLMWTARDDYRPSFATKARATTL